MDTRGKKKQTVFRIVLFATFGMEKNTDIHENIHTISSLLHSHVLETDAQIELLQQTAHLLTWGQDVTGAASPTLNDVTCQITLSDDEAVILELEKTRTDLLMEIQEESYISSKLRAMITECEELVGGVTTYYNNIQDSKTREDAAMEEHVKNLGDSAVKRVGETIRANSSTIDVSQKNLYAGVKEVLQIIEQDGSHLVGMDTQSQLSEAIDMLNEKYECLTQARL
ncbi:hypothetical protein METSCH_A12580 [Metschnikowia aff. pulcherrima]|uniref:Uncharacterized protein n=1 Tax=Metschnikowia aff. pulcherrima TaxID=2163413 RepID=A0A4V1ADR3_9ASCO|nr:hypothetical protein METSCH_A12580 [Metschnikowia aff. pulcherrima]